jgi:hypothetical protein
MHHRENILGKTIQQDVIESIISRTENAVAQSYNTELLNTILKLGLRKGSNYLEIGPGCTRTALIVAMLGLNVVLFDKNDEVISYQKSLFLDHKGEIRKAGGRFNVEKLDAIFAEQYEAYYKYENMFDYIVCLNLFAEAVKDDLSELVSHLYHWGKGDFVVFACTWKEPSPEVPDLILETFYEDARFNLIKFAVIHTGVFTSEFNPYLRNGVIAKVSQWL